MKLSWIFVIVLLVAVAVFSVQNAEPMTVRFFGWEITMSAALVILLAALAGALVGLIVGAMSRKPRPAAEVPPQPQPRSLPEPEPIPRSTPLSPPSEADSERH